jgi:hypothetical protein
MSKTGRYAIDRLKSALSSYLSFPVPPYQVRYLAFLCSMGDFSNLICTLPLSQNPSYWEAAYKRLGPNDVFEWGDLSCSDFIRYSYRRNHYATAGSPGGDKKELEVKDDEVQESTLGETLGVYPHAGSDEPIMILGCGNSKFGEDMFQAGWRGPLVQVDIASRVNERAICSLSKTMPLCFLLFRLTSFLLFGIKG